jgi:hypothetical protein
MTRGAVRKKKGAAIRWGGRVQKQGSRGQGETRRRGTYKMYWKKYTMITPGRVRKD